MNTHKVNIHPSWHTVLSDQFTLPYFVELTTFVRSEYSSAQIYPHPRNIFRAFDLCPFNEVRVVIIGQDPYHGPQQANGLCFAVHEGISIPPSLKNIFKEIASDLGISPEKTNGDLSRWARQGVLLLNATLTVRAQSPGSHQDRGWEAFTDAVIAQLSSTREHIVFLLWGNYAKKKGSIIDRSKHCVLEAAHPSPFSASNGFFGCKHFSKTNQFLQQYSMKEIDWR